MLVLLIQTLLSISLIIYSYYTLFNYEEEFQLYKRAIQEIYKIQSQYYNTENRNSKQHLNSYQIQIEDDFQKLIHKDTILKDLYAQRDTLMKDDAAQIIIQDEYFDTNPNSIRFSDKDHKLLSPFVMFDIHKFLEKQSRYCLFSKQMNFQGIAQLRDKPKLASHHFEYYKKMKKMNKTEKCMKEAGYQKQSYKLYEKDQCINFFEIINSTEYQSKIAKDGFQYVIKGNAHAGESIYVMTKKITEKLRKKYKDGQLCGILKDQFIAQEYIVHPLLFKKNKIDLRIYIAMPSNDPLQIFILNETTIRRCSRKYQPKFFETYSHVCHPSSLEEYQKPYYLTNHLIKEGFINSTDWLQEYFLPHLYRKIGHMFLSTQHKLEKDNSIWQIYAVDLMMDEDLNLWIIECNTNPILYSFYYNSTDVHFKFAKSTIDLISKVIRKKYSNIKKVIFNDLLPVLKNNKNITQKLQQKIAKSFQDPILHSNDTNNLIKISLDKIRKICQ